MRDTWGPPASGWPSFCAHCGKRKAPDALHTCPVPDVAGFPPGDTDWEIEGAILPDGDSFRLDG